MCIKVDNEREWWLDLLRKEGTPGMVGHERIGRLKSPQRRRRREAHKLV